MKILKWVLKNSKLVLYSLLSLCRILKGNNIFLYNHLNKLFTLPQDKAIRILGNGKSLDNFLIKQEQIKVDYMVVNRHVLSESYIQLKPRYYVLADPYFFEHEDGLSILNRIEQTTIWDMILFIPFGKELVIHNSFIKIIYYNCTPFRGYRAIKYYLYRHNLSIPIVQNVLVASIYICICLKYQRIELYGVEHSWTKYLYINDSNEVCLDNPHFYDKETSKPKTWKEIQHADARLCDVLRMYANMFDSYFELQHYAKKYDIQIINYTKDSFIDAFDRYVY